MAQAGEEWAIQVNKEVSELLQTRSTESQRWKQESIYEIPWSMKKLRPSAYQPQMVSIGPYHHRERQLEGMEKNKHRAFLNFLNRSNKPLECYLDALAAVAEDLMGAYDQLETRWKQDTDAFLKLMMVDGCFVLELMRSTTAAPEVLSEMGYAPKDQVFSNHGRLYFQPHLRRDLLMLQNQLPLLVLNKLLAVQGSKEQLTKIILLFLDERNQTRNLEKFRDCVHILDVYRRSLLLGTQGRTPPRSCLCLPGRCCCEKKKKKKKKKKEEEEEAYIRSATELSEAGIRFKKSKTRKLNDVSFCGGVLMLPLITVDDALESEYLNLMAFERFHVGAGNEVTSYVYLMDKLIDSAKDVSLLHWKGIVQNSLGSDKAVARLFNSISTDACLDRDSEVGSILEDVAAYCRQKLPRCMAYAMHHYFTNPWVGLSVLAATFLFALTSLQTVFAALDHYKKKS